MLKKVSNTFYSFVFNKVIVAVAMYAIFVKEAYCDDFDVVAPITTLKKSRDVAAQADISQGSLLDGLGNIGNIAIAVSGLLGVAACIQAGYKLYKNVQDGDQARYSNGSIFVSFVIGAALTIVAVVIGIMTHFVVK